MRNIIFSLCTILLVSILSVINCYGTSTFGTGLDGNLTVSSSVIVNTKNTNLTQNVSAGQTTIIVANAGLFSVNDNILIIQMLGGDTGVYEDVYIHSINLEINEITTDLNLSNSYSVGASAVVQVIKVPNYSNVTINPNGVVTCNNWNNTTGGIIGFKVNNTLTNNGVISASGKGSYGSSGGLGGLGGNGKIPTSINGGIGYGGLCGLGGANYGAPPEPGPAGGHGGAYGQEGITGSTCQFVEYPGFSSSEYNGSLNLSNNSHLLFGASGRGGNGGTGRRGAGAGGGAWRGYISGGGSNWTSIVLGNSGNPGGRGGNGGTGGVGGGIILVNSAFYTGGGTFDSNGNDGYNGESGFQGGSGGDGTNGQYVSPNDPNHPEWARWSGGGGGGNGAIGGNGGDGGNGGAGGVVKFLYATATVTLSPSVTGGNGGAGGIAGLGGNPGTGGVPGGVDGVAGANGSSGLDGLSGQNGVVMLNRNFDFEANDVSGLVPLKVSFTSEVGCVSTCEQLWDFDNNGVYDSTESSPTYTYSIPGFYSVKHRIQSGAISDSLVKENYIHVILPEVPRITATPDTTRFGNVGTNTTASKPITIFNWGGEDLEVYSITVASARYSIVLPSGMSFPLVVPSLSSLQITVNFSPIAVQTYNANLIIVCNDPDTGVLTKRLEGRGYLFDASFIATPLSGDIPLLVQFSDQSQGDVVSRVWDFGDGSTSSEVNPEHTYTQKGSYDVILTIHDQYSSRSMTRPEYINALAHPLIATPDSSGIEYGVVYLGDTETYQLILQSTGTDTVYVYSIGLYQSSSSYNVTPTSFPVYILPGTQAILDISFHPFQEMAYNDTLYVYNSSENKPILKIKLRGIGEYVPPHEPQELAIQIDGYDTVISWEAVTQNIYNTPISVPYYFIYGSVVPIPDPTQQIFLGYSTGTSFRHLGVGLPGSNIHSPREFFYTITAVVWYPPRDRSFSLNELIGLSRDEVYLKMGTK